VPQCTLKLFLSRLHNSSCRRSILRPHKEFPRTAAMMILHDCYSMHATLFLLQTFMTYVRPAIALGNVVLYVTATSNYSWEWNSIWLGREEGNRRKCGRSLSKPKYEYSNATCWAVLTASCCRSSQRHTANISLLTFWHPSFTFTF
jgi:hypothetical protein